MKTLVRFVAASAATLALASVTIAQTSSSNSSAKQNEKDYRSLQYGNGRITPQQNEGIRRRTEALNQAMSDDGSTPTPTPSPTPRQGQPNGGTGSPQ